MSVIILLIICSLFLAIGFLLAYLWASRTGQFEDDYTPSVRILFDDNEGNGANEINPKPEQKT